MVEDHNETPAVDAEHNDHAMMVGYKAPATEEGLLQLMTMGGLPPESHDKRASMSPPPAKTTKSMVEKPP